MSRVKYPRTPHLPFSPGRSAADIGRHVAKYVRPGHVQTGDDWLRAKPVPNGLAR